MATRSVILKRSAIGAAAVVILLLVLIALLPMLISAGLGHGMVRSAIEDNLAPGSRAEFQTLSVTWRGPQEIHRLRIIDPQGEEVADVNVRISPGLWGLAFGTFGVLEAHISGGLPNVEIYDDGTTNLQRVFAIEPDPNQNPMEGVPSLILHVDAIDAVVAHVADAVRHEVAVRDLAGQLTYTAAGAAGQSEVEFEFAARTVTDDAQGDLRLTGQSRNLFDANGAFTPDGAPLNVSLNAANIPVLGMDVPTLLSRLAVAVNSDNLAQLVSANVESEAVIQDEPPSRFRAEINVRVPFRPDGTLDMTLENITATASGERVPSSLLQPMLAATPIVLARDVGRSIDLDARITPADGTAVIRASGPRGSLDVTGMMDAETGWLTADHVAIVTPQAHPDLVRGFTNLTVDRPVNLEITMTQLRVPPVDPALDRRPLAQYGGTGVLRVNEPVAVVLGEANGAGGGQSILLEQGEIQFDSPMLGDYLDLAGTIEAEGGAVSIQQRLTNMFDAAGDMDVMAADFVGEVNAADLPTTTLAQWMPDQQANLRELLGERLNASLTTTLDETGLRGVVAIRGAQSQADVELLRTPDALEILRPVAELVLTPALVQRFQEPPDDADADTFALLEAALVRLELDSFTLRGARPAEYRLEQRDIGGRLSVDRLAVNGIPGVPEAVSVHDVVANVMATLSRDPFETHDMPAGKEPPLLASYAIEGSAGVRHFADGGPVANLAYDVTGQPADAERQTQLDGSLALTGVNVDNVERLLGREPGQFALWVGETGSLNANFSAVGQRYDATLVSDMPRLQGTFAASYTDTLIELNTQDATLALGADAAAQLLGGEEARIVVERDVPLTLNLAARLPMGFIMQETFEHTLLDVRATMRGGPLVMRVGDERQMLENVDLEVTANATAEDLQLHGVAAAAPAAPARPAPPGAIGTRPQQQPQQPRGNISVDAMLREPIVPGQPLAFERTRMDLDAAFNRAPTALADALMQMNGYLTAAVGTTFDGTITARNFSRTIDDGTFVADLESLNGSLSGSGVTRNGAIHFSQERPLEAQLQITPLLRDFLLARLHPIFADLITAQTPLTARFAPAAIPLDGDVSKLSGDATLTIGTIHLDRHSPMFAILALPRFAGLGEIPGLPESAMSATVDPIELSIREGVIDYQRFLLRIYETEMPFTGRINLNTGSVNVRTSMPLALLQIPQLQGVIPREAENLQVPLVASGTLGEPIQLGIAPDFDLAGQLLRMGLERGLLDRLLPRREDGAADPGRTLRDLIRPPRRN